MADDLDNSTNLSIRCPACRQRFKAGKNLMGRMVECGACEHRFRIVEDVVMRSKKFYPGEHKSQILNRFQRVPLPAAAPVGLRTAQYAKLKSPADLEPTSPQRIIAGAFGVLLMLPVALLLIFAGNPGGVFDAMPTQSRLVIAAFASLLGVALLTYANPRARLKGFVIGLILSAALISLPFIFKPKLPTTASTPSTTNAITYRDPEPLFPEAELDPYVVLREKFGTDPLVNEQERLASSSSSKKALGLFLINLREANRFLVRDHIIRAAGAESAHPFPRENSSYLMVVSGTTLNLDQIAGLAAELGQDVEIHHEIDLVSVRVNNDSLVSGPSDKLNNKNDPAFFDLNRRELESIDLNRIEAAVRRLADAEPRIYRDDITRRLVRLMTEDGVTFHAIIARALIVWAEEPGPAGNAAMTTLTRKHEAGEVIPEELVALIVKEKNTAVIPILSELWQTNSTQWESHYANLGPAAEDSVLKILPETENQLTRSAIRILGRTGSSKSIPALEKLSSSRDNEVRVLVAQALTSIRAR